MVRSKPMCCKRKRRSGFKAVFGACLADAKLLGFIGAPRRGVTRLPRARGGQAAVTAPVRSGPPRGSALRAIYFLGRPCAVIRSAETSATADDEAARVSAQLPPATSNRVLQNRTAFATTTAKRTCP